MAAIIKRLRDGCIQTLNKQVNGIKEWHISKEHLLQANPDFAKYTVGRYTLGAPCS